MLCAHTSYSLRAINLPSLIRGPLNHLVWFLSRSRQECIQGRGKDKVYLWNGQRDLVEKSTLLNRRKANLNPVSGRATDLLNNLNQTSPLWSVTLSPVTLSELSQGASSLTTALQLHVCLIQHPFHMAKFILDFPSLQTGSEKILFLPKCFCLQGRMSVRDFSPIGKSDDMTEGSPCSQGCSGALPGDYAPAACKRWREKRRGQGTDLTQLTCHSTPALL